LTSPYASYASCLHDSYDAGLYDRCQSHVQEELTKASRSDSDARPSFTPLCVSVCSSSPSMCAATVLMSIFCDENEKSMLKKKENRSSELTSRPVGCFKFLGTLNFTQASDCGLWLHRRNRRRVVLFFRCQELFPSDIFERHQDDGTVSAGADGTT